MNLSQKLLAWLAVGALIGFATLYVFELKHFGNTLNFSDLALKSALLGLALGLLAGWYFQKKAGRQEMVDNIRRWTICIIVPIVLAPLLGSLTNRMFSPYPAEMKPFEFFDEKPYASSAYGFMKDEKITPDGWYLFVNVEGSLRRIEHPVQRFPDAQRGDLVELKVQRGLWGYQFLE